MTVELYFSIGVILAFLVAVYAAFSIPRDYYKLNHSPAGDEDGDVFFDGVVVKLVLAGLSVVAWPAAIPAIGGIAYYRHLENSESEAKKLDEELASAKAKRDELAKIKEEIQQTEGWLNHNVRNWSDLE